MKHIYTLFFLLAGYIAEAQTSYNWTGAVNTNWNTPGNWSPMGVPGELDRVRIFEIISFIPEDYVPIPNWPELQNDITLAELSVEYGEIDLKGYKVTTTEVFDVYGSTVNSTPSYKINLKCKIFAISRGSTLHGNSIITTDVFGDYNANAYIGDTKIIIEGTENSETGGEYTDTEQRTQFDGNLEIERRAAGQTDLFKYVGADILGNFKYTNLVGGNSSVGLFSSGISILGKIDLDLLATGSDENSNLEVNRLNGNSGGTISFKNFYSAVMRNNNIKVDIVEIVGLRNGGAGYLQDNTLGNLFLLTPDSNKDWYIELEGTKFTGKSTFDLTNGGIIFGLGIQFFEDTKFVSRDRDIFFILPKRVEFYKGLSLEGNSNAPFLAFYSEFTFKGTEDSKFETSGLPDQSFVADIISVEKSGSGKLIISQPIDVLGKLTFKTGIVENNATSPITLADNAVVSGASDVSHVVGPVHKKGNDAFSFPIGSSTKLFPVSITGPALATDEFSAEYVASNPSASGYSVNSKAASLATTYNKGFWNVSRVNGSSNVGVSLGYSFPEDYVTDQSKLRVAHWNGSQWEDLGNGGTSGSVTVGSVSTSAAVSSFSPFTIASSDASNPLPVKLAKFTVTKEHQTALLNWATTEEINSDRFEVEHSLNAVNWTKLGEVKSVGESRSLSSYDYQHVNPDKGLNYYRLKMVDLDGSYAFSKILSLRLSSGNSISVYPNPVSDMLFIETNEPTTKIELINVTGNTVLSIKQQIAKDGIDLSKLIPGIYFVKIDLASGQKENFKIFVNR